MTAIHSIETLHEQFLLAKQEALQEHTTHNPDDRDVWLSVQEEVLEEAEVLFPQTLPRTEDYFYCRYLLKEMHEQYEALTRLFVGLPPIHKTPVANGRDADGRLVMGRNSDGKWVLLF